MTIRHRHKGAGPATSPICQSWTIIKIFYKKKRHIKKNAYLCKTFSNGNTIINKTKTANYACKN